jgi:hypothetical protein
MVPGTADKPRLLLGSRMRDGLTRDGTASLKLAMEVAEYFELDASAARDIAKQTGRAVAQWRLVANERESGTRKSIG